ncbi:MAG: hypothetical protein NVSMB53_20040 [Gemmatimonadaceae bacterium]
MSRTTDPERAKNIRTLSRLGNSRYAAAARAPSGDGPGEESAAERGVRLLGRAGHAHTIYEVFCFTQA